MNRRDLLLATGGVAVGMAVGLPRVHGQDAVSPGIPAPIQQLLDPRMDATLLDKVPVDQDFYFVIAQTESEFGSGEPVVARLAPNGSATLVSDFSTLPDDVITGTLSAVASGPGALDLSQFVLNDADLTVQPPSATAAASDVVDGKLSNQAILQMGVMSSRNAPGTDNGNLACAWAVNQIAKKALGAEIGGGLATANMIKVLRLRHHPIEREEAARKPGTVIISPTVYRPSGANIGHVGIIATNGEVMSNSSRHALWMKTHDLQKWFDYYTGRKGLETLYYRLDDRYF